MPESIVIIGAGLAGGRAALALRDNGFQGRIHLIGAEPLAPYDRPPLSKAGVTAPSEHAFITTDSEWQERDIELVTGEAAIAINRTAKSVTLSNGRKVNWDRLLLATGARPRLLPDLPRSKRILTLRTAADAEAIGEFLKPGQCIAIVGGGFIGLELAAVARSKSADVVLIEAAPRLMGRAVPSEIAAVIEARHRAEGIDIRLSTGLDEIVDEGDCVTLHLSDDTSLSADCAVIGIGAVPNTALAEAAGLAIDNGIAVDETLTTSDPAILACGDCASFPLSLYGGRRVRLESWRAAQDLGLLAARNLMGANEAINLVPWFWSEQFDLTLQIAGLADGTETIVRRELGDGAFILFHVSADGCLVAASGVGPGQSVARDIRLAELLIGRGAHPDLQKLADPETKLKSLL